MGDALTLRRYRILRPDGETWAGPFDHAEIVDRISARTKGSGPLAIKRPGEDRGRFRPRDAALRRFADDLREARVGERLRLIAREAPPEPVVVRKVQLRVRIPETPGNQHVDEFLARVVARWPDVENWGTLANRPVGSTAVPSQHSCYEPLPRLEAQRWGFDSPRASRGANAIDLHHDRKRIMGSIFTLAIADADPLWVAHAIYDGREFTPEGGVRPYDVPAGGSMHRDHVHVAFRPFRSPGALC